MSSALSDSSASSSLLFSIRRSLYAATTSRRLVVGAPNAKPLKGFAGGGVLEVVANHDGNTYRAVYTVKFAKSVYVLHAFQKKSKKGIATPKSHVDLIKRRLKSAGEHYERTYGS
jgi:phage-related protein